MGQCLTYVRTLHIVQRRERQQFPVYTTHMILRRPTSHMIFLVRTKNHMIQILRPTATSRHFPQTFRYFAQPPPSTSTFRHLQTLPFVHKVYDTECALGEVSAEARGLQEVADQVGSLRTELEEVGGCTHGAPARRRRRRWALRTELDGR